jgi:hypothetical protein
MMPLGSLLFLMKRTQQSEMIAHRPELANIRLRAIDRSQGYTQMFDATHPQQL